MKLRFITHYSSLTPNQKGFSPAVILIAVGVIAAIIAAGYFFLSARQTPDSAEPEVLTVPLTQEDPLQSKVGTPECPELDYTGCDNTGDFMTWEDDGLR